MGAIGGGRCSPGWGQRTGGTRAPSNIRQWQGMENTSQIFTESKKIPEGTMRICFGSPHPLLLVVLHILPSAVKISYFIFTRRWTLEFHEQRTIGSVYSPTIKSLFNSGLQVAEPSGPYLHSKTLSVTQKMITSTGQTNVTSK